MNILESPAVSEAFSRFQTKFVDLEKSHTERAVLSRNFLIEQVESLSQLGRFPKIIGNKGAFIPYGSFARKTKIRPLDDIDLLVCLVGSGTSEKLNPNNEYEQWLRINDSNAYLAQFADDHGYVNSTKVLNSIKTGLAGSKSYKQADIKRNQEAVTLTLDSYEWNFDIVPAIPVGNEYGTSHFLIPNGRGDWKRTDPRLDDNKNKNLSLLHANNFNPMCRLLKFWNARTHKPRLPSYYFEVLVQNCFEKRIIYDRQYALLHFFQAAPSLLLSPCPDPKKLGVNLDADVDISTKLKVSSAMGEAATVMSSAKASSSLGYPLMAVSQLKDVFGEQFGK
jgi:hypothetical protein